MSYPPPFLREILGTPSMVYEKSQSFVFFLKIIQKVQLTRENIQA